MGKFGAADSNFSFTERPELSTSTVLFVGYAAETISFQLVVRSVPIISKIPDLNSMSLELASKISPAISLAFSTSFSEALNAALEPNDETRDPPVPLP